MPFVRVATYATRNFATIGLILIFLSLESMDYIIIDFSMFKTYSAEILGTNMSAQFRAEVFNLTNTPQFYGPNTQFGSSNFGQITSQANFNRVFQLGVRFFF